ncbi:hypothetical protein [Cyclobacterium sp. SYSU L10401]|uniref:hypothetical protein n=1 Tax=Cyclobacterium sp. SYSU L10401 TaxID=2678657 RepID=UPI0013D1EEDE|nr:hypothetical protein [Cyclobacterium sp. SYSU L10401]
MGSYLFFISILLAFMKCCSQGEINVSKELLVGSWASCHDDGLYLELHFTEVNDYAYHLDGDILDFNVGKYIVCSDKIHISIQENDLNCAQNNVEQIDITFKSGDEFESKEMGKIYNFRRLSDKPIMNYRLGTKVLEREGYMDGFRFRKDTFNCSNNIIK